MTSWPHSSYQFALQTRGGTEALAHLLGYSTDRDDETLVVSLDGVEAFDHVERAALLTKVASEPRLQILPHWVRMLYGSLSVFLWTDAEGITREIL